MLTSIVGINWGDEGKGRMVDLLSREQTAQSEDQPRKQKIDRQIYRVAFQKKAQGDTVERDGGYDQAESRFQRQRQRERKLRQKNDKGRRRADDRAQEQPRRRRQDM